MSQFNDSQPIFVQIRQRIVEMILKKAVAEGDALPSVRQIATDLSVNPLTVTKAYDGLVDAGAVESRRGMGMFVLPGARDRLLAGPDDPLHREGELGWTQWRFLHATGRHDHRDGTSPVRRREPAVAHGRGLGCRAVQDDDVRDGVHELDDRCGCA